LLPIIGHPASGIVPFPGPRTPDPITPQQNKADNATKKMYATPRLPLTQHAIRNTRIGAHRLALSPHWCRSAAAPPGAAADHRLAVTQLPAEKCFPFSFYTGTPLR
jgi:hypothetical protein